MSKAGAAGGTNNLQYLNEQKGVVKTNVTRLNMILNIRTHLILLLIANCIQFFYLTNDNLQNYN